MGVGETSHDFDFPVETLCPDRGRDVRLEHFERDLAVVLAIMSEANEGHRTRSEFVLDRVAVSECGANSRTNALHGIYSSPGAAGVFEVKVDLHS
jgi:hypothetical protein